MGIYKKMSCFSKILKRFYYLIPFKNILRRIKHNTMLFFWQQKYSFLKTTKIVHPPQGLGDVLYVLLCLEAKKYIKDFKIAPVQKYMEFCSLKKINPDKYIKEFIFEENKFYFFD